MTDDEHREHRYRVVDAGVYVLVICLIVAMLLLTGCDAAPVTAPPEPPPLRPGVCWGPPPCLSLRIP